MPLLSAEALAKRLEARHGLALTGFIADVSGGQFAAVRPLDLDSTHGFEVQIARSPRSVSAVFNPDLFSGKLLRDMALADAAAKQVFEELFRNAEIRGFNIAFEINGRSLDPPLEWPDETWRRLELECIQRIPLDRRSDTDVERLAVNTASYLFALLLALLPIEEIEEFPDTVGRSEGTKISTIATRYERNLANRTACIVYHGTCCSACGFDFGSTYGDLGEGYIEVHHRTPLALMEGTARVDPIRDLIPLCSNCHSMVHRHTPPIPVEDLRNLLFTSTAYSGNRLDT